MFWPEFCQKHCSAPNKQTDAGKQRDCARIHSCTPALVAAFTHTQTNTHAGIFSHTGNMFDFDDDGSKLTEAGGKRKYEALLKKKSKSLENLETKLEERVR